MTIPNDYECDGQMEITDFLISRLTKKRVMDLTAFINSQGKAQYEQIGEIVSKTYEEYKDTDMVVERITNIVSIYVLQQSLNYMEYLRKEAKGE